MGHKGPVLRPRCNGPGRARTQILSIQFNSIQGLFFCIVLPPFGPRMYSQLHSVLNATYLNVSVR